MATTRNVPHHPSSAPSRTASPAHTEPSARRRVPRWAVPLAAAAVAAVVLLVGTAAGVDVAARSGVATRAVGLADVVVAGLAVGLLGWAVRAVLSRLRRDAPGRGERAWLVTCAVVLLVSLLGPLGGVGGGSVAVLLAEHVAVGAVVALGLRRA
jgi:hypothetical protein